MGICYTFCLFSLVIVGDEIDAIGRDKLFDSDPINVYQINRFPDNLPVEVIRWQNYRSVRCDKNNPQPPVPLEDAAWAVEMTNNWT